MHSLTTIPVLIVCVSALSCCVSRETNAAAVEAGDACAPYTPCGGDLEGDWEISTGCFSFMRVSGGPVIPSCPAATMEYVPDAAGGSYSFRRDGRYAAQFEVLGRLVLTMPTSCLKSGATCITLEDTKTGRSCASTSNQTCRCTELLTQSTDQLVTGSYELRSSQIDFSNDVSMTYCQQSDQLTLETVSHVEMGDKVDGKLRFVLVRPGMRP